jgi:hypothetical protein
MTFCFDCLLNVDHCPKCKQPLAQNRVVRVKKRQIGMERTKERVVSVMAMSSLTARKYGSNEMRGLYQTKMFDFVEDMRTSFIGLLE